ncbi:hypothetical protein A45J_0773 [hot springs metagenome]|uniref:HEAT repeat domain-containing protein n=1 Tax=hot springs metagenome TaxID=433727 RepID=A0A5J4L176_9ZZZZ
MLCTKAFKNMMVLCALFLIVSQGHAASHDIDKLLIRLQHDDPKLRLSAMEELGKIGDGDSVMAIMKVVENQGEDWKIKIRAIKLLAEIKNPMTVDLLIKVLDDPFFTYDCPALKWNAAIALGNFKNYAKAVDALIDALNDKTLYVKEAAIQSLGEIGDRRAVPYLVLALSDKSFAIRISAIKALGKIRDVEAIPFLRKVLDNATDHYIKEETENAIKIISDQMSHQ